MQNRETRDSALSRRTCIIRDAAAFGIISSQLSRVEELGWEQRNLRATRKGHEGKVALARELRAKTSVELKWIARRLEMGSWSNVANLLRKDKSGTDPKIRD